MYGFHDRGVRMAYGMTPLWFKRELSKLGKAKQ